VRCAEGLVRGQDDRALLIPLGDHLEDQVRLRAFKGLAADLINHEDARPQVGAELAGQAPGGLGGPEDHVVEAGEVDRVAGPASGDRQSDGQVGLSDPGRYQRFTLRSGMLLLVETFMRSV
jgi:hypothetical protein